MTTPNRTNLFFPGILAILMVIPAFFVNLGITPLIEDESIRSLVSLEMIYSGDYITPTVGGSLYFNKPPLFNWIIATFFRIGGPNELMLRLPVVISLLLFSLTIFLSVKKHLGTRIAFITALTFLTCGRILTYDSLKGLIDILFSWILFGNFMVLFNGFTRNKLFSAFLKSYLLLIPAFMLKGLPALVFQGLTMVTLVFYFHRWRSFRILFSFTHILSILLFLGVTSVYYVVYFRENPGTSEEMFSIIFQQSARRTALKFGFEATMVHLLTYPFEFINHFLPWTVLIVLFFLKKSRQLLKDQFITVLLLIFLVNITIYWTSPESFARYVLMLVPMLYIVLIFLFENANRQNRTIRFFYYGFLACMLLIFLVSASVPFLRATAGREHILAKTVFLLVFEGLIFYLSIKRSQDILLNTALFLLVVRIGFNWFVLTHRVDHMEKSMKRIYARNIGHFVRNQEIYVYGKPFKYFDEDSSVKYISFFTRFYISAEAGKIIRDSDIIKPGCFYLVKKEDLKGKQYIDYSGLGIIRDRDPRFLVQFR